MRDERSYVMAGNLSDFPLGEVLDVVGLSRQHTMVELQQQDGSTVASIYLKAGHLVQSSSGENPRVALDRALRADRSCTFHVFRLSDARDYESHGRLADLLGDPGALVVEDARSFRTSTAVQASAPSRVDAPVAVSAPPAQAEPMPGDVRVSLAVASPKGGVGKTTIALNLGIGLARRALQVIVIDADINGDLLSLVNARGSVDVGAYDVLAGSVSLEDALRSTVMPGLRVLPAVGREFPGSAVLDAERPESWRRLIDKAVAVADVVLVDCPAGMSHTTRQVLRNVSYVLGVLQAEAVASRSFEMFERGLAALSEAERPAVAGIVVNMFRKDEAGSQAYSTRPSGDPSRRVFETAIGRSDAFEQAAVSGMPVQLEGSDASREVAWVFDALAAELALRLPLAKQPLGARTFLV